jgi:hypothetical protein
MGFQPDQAVQAGERAYSEGQAKSWVDRSVHLRNSWNEASTLRGDLSLMQQLALDPNVASGKLAEDISGLKSLGESFGVKLSGLPAEEGIKAIATKMALAAKNSGGTNMMPGAVSNYEQGLLKSMVPQLAQSREGRQLLIQVLDAKAQRDQTIAEMAANYEDKHGKLDNGFEREVRAYARANPMFSEQRAKAMQELAKRLGGAQ